MFVSIDLLTQLQTFNAIRRPNDARFPPNKAGVAVACYYIADSPVATTYQFALPDFPLNASFSYD